MSEYPKKYKTRDGREAEVWKNDGRNLLGAYYSHGQWCVCGWDIETGLYAVGSTQPFDLILPPELAVGQVWKEHMNDHKHRITEVCAGMVCYDHPEHKNNGLKGSGWSVEEFIKAHTFLTAPECSIHGCECERFTAKLLENHNCGEYRCHPQTNPDPTPTCPHCGDGMVKADSWTCYCGWGSR